MNVQTPDGWIAVALGDVCDLYQPKTVAKKDLMPEGKFRVYGANGPIGYYDRYNHEAAELTVTCRGATCGTVNMIPGPSWITGNAMVVRPRVGLMDKQFLSYQLMGADWSGVISGSAQPQITRTNLAPLTVLVAPSAEQERIVTAIEEHLSCLDAAEARLRNASARLSGLVGAALHEAAEGPKRLVGELLSGSNYGTSAKCGYDGAGPAVLRIPNIRRRSVCLDDLKRANSSGDVGESAFVQDGDVLVVRTNGSQSLIGRTAVVRSPEPSLAFASYLIRLNFDSSIIVPEFASMMLESPQLRGAIERLAASSAGQFNLSLSKIKSLELPVPDREVQHRLVGWFDEIEDHGRRVESAIASGKARSNGLRGSILSAAFSGQLVPHDPSDEPASELLERIASEQPVKKSRRKKSS